MNCELVTGVGCGIAAGKDAREEVEKASGLVDMLLVLVLVLGLGLTSALDATGGDPP